MMKNTLYLFVAILCFACKQPPGQLIKHEEDSIYLSELEGFNIPYSSDFSDSNHLFFTSRGFFDTTFIFHIRKTVDDVRGVVYMPRRVGRYSFYDLSKDAKQDDYAYPFSGYGFKLDNEQWEELIAQVNLVIKDTAAIRNRYENSQCTDGTPRTMLYNGLVIQGTNCDDLTFEKFTDYIKEHIVWKLKARQYIPGF